MPSTTGVSNTSTRSGDATIKFNGSADKTINGLSVGELGRAADRIAARVHLPSRAKLSLSTKRGMGPRGAFSQVIMRGSGALAIEFGTRRRRAVAPLRRALGTA